MRKFSDKCSRPVYYKMSWTNAPLKAWVRGRCFVYNETSGKWSISHKFSISAKNLVQDDRRFISLPAGVPPLPKELIPS